MIYHKGRGTGGEREGRGGGGGGGLLDLCWIRKSTRLLVTSTQWAGARNVVDISSGALEKSPCKFESSSGLLYFSAASALQ